ncbi:MAG: NAD+ synthase, partial [Frankia sp.]|nr:NAD+ synthase [Frankia sp.]
WTARAVEAGADVLAFPEMTLTGYPPEDLVYRRSFLDANLTALQALASESGDLPVVVGYLDDDGGRRNAAAVLQRGEVRARYFKHFLPNYGVFDEERYFEPGVRLPLVRIAGVDVAVLICEDLWQAGGPVAAAGAAGAGLAIVINGSPYEQGKSDYRLELVARRAREAACPFAYVNTVGGQDELVFDGDSMVVGADGRLLARAPRFTELLLVHDVDIEPPAVPGEASAAGTELVVERVDLTTGARKVNERADGGICEPLAEEAEVWGAIVTATRDYVRKNGFASVVLGLSGGIDSAVVATVAVDALGAPAVHTVGLPSAYSSPGSRDDAAELARRQGTPHCVIEIQPAVDAYAAMLAASGGLTGLAAENLQARVRGTTLMALSNEHGHLVLTTGNKSELATGFSTLYGDSAGGFAPIKDVPKTLVWRLAEWRNAEARSRNETEPIPTQIISKPPSAELAPGQLDADRLPAYDVLDAVLDDYVERDLGRDALIARGHDTDLVKLVIGLVDAAEYKRRQYPPGPKITPKNFGRDRRLPITNRFAD